ncbi:MAG TPA: hypothetical protein VK203_00040 [Nostocaceae cyanobacterium]|nr:hypothetical protein [Nostocaceae cyanobacterium]
MLKIQQNSDHLVIRQDKALSNILGYTLLSVFLIPFFIFPLSFISSFLPRQQTLKCTRSEPIQVNCQVQETIKVINQNKEISSINLTGVEIITHSDQEENYQVYQLQLISKTEKFNFGYSRLYQSEISPLAQKINSFLTNPTQRSFQLTQENNVPEGVNYMLIFFIFWYGILIISVLTITFSFFSCPLVEMWVFDRKCNKLILTKQFIFKLQNKSEYALSGKSYLETEYIKDSDGDEYHLRLILESGEKLTLNCPNNEVNQMFQVVGEFLQWKQQNTNGNKNIRFQ